MPKVCRTHLGGKAIIAAMLVFGVTSSNTNAQIVDDMVSPDLTRSVSRSEIAIPDLSVYDAQALREIAQQLYRVIDHLNHELSQTNQLRADFSLLKTESAHLRKECQNLRAQITPQPHEGVKKPRIDIPLNKVLPQRIQNQIDASIFPTKPDLASISVTTPELDHAPWKYSYRPGLIDRNGQIVAMDQEKGHIWIGPTDGGWADPNQVVFLGEFTNLSKSDYRYWIVIKVFQHSRSGDDNTIVDREIGSWPYRTSVLRPDQTHHFEVRVPITEPVVANLRNRVEVEVIPVLP